MERFVVALTREELLAGKKPDKVKRPRQDLQLNLNARDDDGLFERDEAKDEQRFR